MTAPMVDYKIHWLKMMSVTESRAVVGRHDGINGRDRLNQPPNRARIIAVHDAQPRDGGSGALYLLLRKRR